MQIEENIDKRLDMYLSEILDSSRTRIQELIKSGNIKVNNKIVKASYKLMEGDVLDIDIPEVQEVEIVPQNIPIDIVYEDEYLLVVNKKAGMVVHPAKSNEDGTLVNALLYHIKDLSGINGELRPGIVHRLDKNTSGLIIVAKDDKTHAKLTDMFKEKQIEKIYYAIIKGKVKNPKGRIETYIGRDPNDRKKMAVRDTGKWAITNYEIVDSNERYSLVRVKLETGRTHQIRVHLSTYLFSILGDEVYGRKDKYSRQMLHAYSLYFKHPINDTEIFLKGEFHDDFKAALRESALNFEEN